MTLVRWKPVGDMVSLQDEVNRLFDEVWRRSAPRSGLNGWVPAVDLLETPNEFRLVAELPGVIRENVKISLTDNVLTLRGEKQSQVEEKGENWQHVERGYGAFERSFNLTNSVDSSKVKAKFENGVLTVTLPKTETARPRQISIDG